MSEQRDDEGRCPDCRAEVDHYLGCPEDPDPDYEAEAEYIKSAAGDDDNNYSVKLDRDSE